MAGSQVWLARCVLARCAWRLAAFDVEDPLMVPGDAELLKLTAQMAGSSQGMFEDRVTLVYTLTNKLVAGSHPRLLGQPLGARPGFTGTPGPRPGNPGTGAWS